MELESSFEKWQKQGVGIVAISYDEPEVIRHVAERLGGFSYPLLADPESRIIGDFGVRNLNFEEGTTAWGMAFPGTFLVDAEGVVRSKYFEEMHRQRYTADTVLLKEFGDGGGRRLEATTRAFKLVAYASQDVIRPGNRILLSIEIDLPEGMHLYAPGAAPYRPLELRVPESAEIQAGATDLPPAKRVYLEPIEETVPIFENAVRLEHELTFSPRLDDDQVTVETELRYQACDEEVCFPPTELPLTFRFDVAPHDVERVPEELRRAADD